MDKALVYETRDSGFDPQWSRFIFSIPMESPSLNHFAPY